METLIKWLVNTVVVVALLIAGGLVGLLIALKGVEMYVQYYPLENTEVVAQ